MRLTGYGFILWFTRFFGLIISAFFLLFLAGEGFSQLLDGKTAVIPILFMILTAVGGYILSWKRIKAGAWTMIVAGCIMIIYLLILSGLSQLRMAFSFGLPFVFAGLLYLLVTRKKKVKN